jgi:hypothetical protein
MQEVDGLRLRVAMESFLQNENFEKPIENLVFFLHVWNFRKQTLNHQPPTT